MDYQTFLQLLPLAEVTDEKDKYVFAESQHPCISEAMLATVWSYAHDRSVQCLRHMTGMTRQDFSKAYQIPYRTVTDWERGERVPPPYVLDLLAFVVMFGSEGDSKTEIG